MPVEQIEIEKFLLLSEKYPVLDVRTPGEYLRAHIPGALSLPLFSDDERKIIGTKYKQQSREEAVKTGLEIFSERMKIIHNEALDLSAVWHKKNNITSKTGQQYFILHCWRGGMRSATVAWLLSLYGYKIYTINGGYKAFRKWALEQFERKYNFKILGGYTGSGKTLLLKEISKKNKQAIDLEKLANHKGSAFGSLGEKQQPSQEMFENLLAIELYKIESDQKLVSDNSYLHTKKNMPEIWLEDESRNIGRVSIPNAIWIEMRKSPVYFLDIPFEQRLDHLVKNYGAFDKEDLRLCIIKINKRLGGLNTKNALYYLQQNNIKDCFAILLNYYDKYYSASLENRENFLSLLNKIQCENVDVSNAETVLDKA